MFTNPRTNNIALVFVFPDLNVQNRLLDERPLLEPTLVALATEQDPEVAKADLRRVSALLDDASIALSKAISNGSAQLSTYALDINTARVNVSSSMSAITTAETTLSSAEAKLTLAKAGQTKEALAAEAADVKSAKANLEAAQAAYRKTLITAPFSGTIATLDLKKGEAISANTESISLISLGAFEVETYVPEVSVARLHVGDEATTTLDAYGSSVSFPASVVSIAPGETVRDGVTTYKTLLSFSKTDERVRSGMSASVVITTGSRANAVIVPKGAVYIKDGASYVRVKEGNDAVEQRVTVEPTAALGQVEVTEGLSEGDVIYLAPPAL